MFSRLRLNDFEDMFTFYTESHDSCQLNVNTDVSVTHKVKVKVKVKVWTLAIAAFT